MYRTILVVISAICLLAMCVYAAEGKPKGVLGRKVKFIDGKEGYIVRIFPEGSLSVRFTRANLERRDVEFYEVTVTIDEIVYP